MNVPYDSSLWRTIRPIPTQDPHLITTAKYHQVLPHQKTGNLIQVKHLPECRTQDHLPHQHFSLLPSASPPFPPPPFADSALESLLRTSISVVLAEATLKGCSITYLPLYLKPSNVYTKRWKWFWCPLEMVVVWSLILCTEKQWAKFVINILLTNCLEVL